MGYKKTNKEIENCIVSELSNLVSEFELGELTKEGLFSYISTILIDADVDSSIVINVFEEGRFGEEGANEAMGIKVRQGL